MDTIIHNYPNMIPLRLLMHERRMSCEDLATAIGMSKASFSKRINGKIDWSLTEIWQIAKVLEISLERIFYFFPDPTEEIGVKKIYDCG